MGRASKDKRDIFYRKAKAEGYRARSAYKLLQMHETLNILDPAEIRTGAVDLCAAPGSWSQVLAHHFKSVRTAATAAAESAVPAPRVVAVDLQEMAPIDGVSIVQGDITSEATATEIIRVLNAPEPGAAGSCSRREDGDEQDGDSAQPPPPPPPPEPRKADIVLCDGAPDVTGMHELDEYLQHHLLLAALHITVFVLRPGGSFVAKMFRGPNTPFLIAKSELFFHQVRVVKPTSSRNASMESFIVCQDFRLPPGYVPRFTAGEQDVGHRDAEVGVPSRASSFTPAAPSYAYDTAACPSQDAAASPRTACVLASAVLQPFMACGDLSGLDADFCYDREAGADVLAPVQPPLQAPYLVAAAAGAAGAAVAGTGVLEEALAKKARVEPTGARGSDGGSGGA
ncbi:FtsJ-like methyltransferase [Novymonas esmeraldas]|uniref:Putative tRNA (cytidine(32)/guanosine(34)-2'-O)-methyltransferase n=1 Tax=Novymonas esmeraldas TaxID=1808958 RepID=A0AAW0EU51_9TRYP